MAGSPSTAAPAAAASTQPDAARAPISLLVLHNVSKKKNFGGAKTANLVTRKNKGVKNAKRFAN